MEEYIPKKVITKRAQQIWEALDALIPDNEVQWPGINYDYIYGHYQRIAKLLDYLDSTEKRYLLTEKDLMTLRLVEDTVRDECVLFTEFILTPKNLKLLEGEVKKWDKGCVRRDLEDLLSRLKNTLETNKE